MTTVRLKATADAVAIYTVPDEGSTDDSPHSSPGAHVSRLRFHSSFPTPAIIKTGGQFVRSGTLSIPLLFANSSSRVVYTLFAHGLAGTPIVFGRITIGANVVPLCGCVPFQLENFTGAGRWAALGAGSTNVVLGVSSMARTSASLAAIDIGWEVFVTDFVLDGTPPASTDDKFLRMEADRLTVNNGQFDSLRRYIRIAASSPQFALAKGKTVDVATIDGSGNDDCGHAVRYSLAGYVSQFTPSGTSQPNTSFNGVKTDMKF